MSLELQNLLTKTTSLSAEQAEVILESLGPSWAAKDFASSDEIIANLAQELGMASMKDIPIIEITADMIRDLPINFAKQHQVLPFKLEGEHVLILTSNPVNQKALGDLQIIFGKRTKPILVSSQKLTDAINRVYEKSTANLSGLDEIEEEEYDLEDSVIDLLEAGEDDAPVIKLVNSVLFRAVKEKASDIHIEPYEKDMLVRYRIDGVLTDVFKPPKKLQNAITSRIKVMGNLNIAEKRLPQDGRIPLKVGGKDIDIRLSTVPTSFGERLVMRLQDRSNVVLEMEQLGYNQKDLETLHELIQRTYGIVLVTGPTGSGKSTSLYAMLSKLNSPDVNILTIEDPVEQRIHGLGQVQVNAKIGLTFAAGLRSFLRQDPDTIMVGEIRDLETAELAINASLTGHLVLSTIHANDAAGAFPRLIDIGAEPFLIASSILGILSQRLVRVLCPHCKKRHNPSSAEMSLLGITPAQIEGTNICKPVGCDHCGFKGYSGRTLIMELLVVTEDIRSLVMQRKDAGTVKKQAIANGMTTFREHGLQKVMAGITSIEELLGNTQIDV